MAEGFAQHLINTFAHGLKVLFSRYLAGFEYHTVGDSAVYLNHGEVVCIYYEGYVLLCTGFQMAIFIRLVMKGKSKVKNIRRARHFGRF